VSWAASRYIDAQDLMMTMIAISSLRRRRRTNTPARA